jgi:hypothetical protein
MEAGMTTGGKGADDNKKDNVSRNLFVRRRG